MARDIPPLVAATGELAVVYRTAAYTWGTYSATYPEGVEPREFEWGRELGYVGRLDSPPPDLGSRCWIRADVSVDGVEQYSTIPETFDAAEQRSAGDVFFESDIPREGLGRLEVGVDFVRGDIVPVLVANKLLELPVTVADFVSAAGGELDSRVHVGGLMTGSRSEREQNIEMLRRQIRQDSEDWAEALGAERVARREAISAEAEARTEAIGAEARRSDAYADSVASGVESRLSRDFAASYERYSKALTQLGDTWRQELQKGLSAEQRARVEALRQEQQAREKAGTDLRGELEKSLGDAVAGEARARQAAIANLSKSFTTDLQAYGELVKEAKNYVDPATKAVVAFWSPENQNKFNQTVQLWTAAQAAYNDVNDIKWVSQDAWNEQQQKINEARVKFEEQQRTINEQQKEINRQQRVINDQQKLITTNQAKALAEIARTQISATSVTRDVVQSTANFGVCRVTNSSVEIDFAPGWVGVVIGTINIEAANNYARSFFVSASGVGGTKTVLTSLAFQSFNDALFIGIPK